jgi:Dolichyl-phosphate-mannose-protein mannosyltransferase
VARRHPRTGSARPHLPRRILARYGGASVALLVVFAAIALWNVVHYPPLFGYDAVDHIAYADGLVHDGTLPDRRGEYYTPPGFYAVAGGAIVVGEQLGMGDPLRLVQLVNALLAIATAVLVLELARTIWPGRHRLALAALGFFACGALVLKSAAMVHPETMSTFFTTLGLLLAARMLVSRRFSLGQAAATGAALGAGQLVRAFALWTFGVVVLALAFAALTQPGTRSAVLRAGAVVIAATAVVAGPWYVFQATRYANPVFDQPQVSKPLWERRPASFYLDPGLPELVTAPYRPHFANRFGPELYAEAWGDWFGIYRWHSATGGPSNAARRDLVLQSVVGLLPTALAVAGWLALLVHSLRRRLAELLLVALLPLAGIVGMLYFTVAYPTPDGDVIKAIYMLTTVPAWSLAFGWAVDELLLRLPRLAPALGLALAACALVSLRFSIYGAPLRGLL